MTGTLFTAALWGPLSPWIKTPPISITLRPCLNPRGGPRPQMTASQRLDNPLPAGTVLRLGKEDIWPLV